MADKKDNGYEQSEIYRMRHSAAHVMAEAVLSLFPEAKLAIGPPIEDGFYYDFDLGKDENGKPITFSPEDLDRKSRVGPPSSITIPDRFLSTTIGSIIING